ncbi:MULTISPECIES: TonB-dependent receptor [unclassified Methylobacterium]|jgi:iron complex outermembrane receptor protein|uniref:TonB-dependent receptor n=1 Tax=unclassified Methylobacterium TaxID=2615210 RepID=UPI001FEED148|nr:TonB-dependent receptor [Methylobacterium sp. 2A]
MRNCGATIDRHHRSGDRGNRTKRPLPTILLTAVAFLPGISQAQNFSARQVLPAETSPSPELSTAPVRRQGGQTEKAAREARVNGSHRTQRDADFAETMVELEPVTVTARKQSEDPQKVPISLTVVPDAGATVAPSASNASLARSVPNMTFFDGGGIYGNTFSIRGIGSISPLSSDDTSAVMYVDDVPQPAYGIAPSLLDTERVEVLRGPQGTLLGRNTQAGAVNVVSRRPTFDRAFSLGGEVGSHGYGLGQFTANGTLVPDTLAGRLAMRWNGFGGDIPNIAAGGKEGDLNIGAARGSLLFTPDDRTEALLAFNYGRETTHSPRFMLRDAPGFPVSATDPKTLAEGETGSGNLRIRHELDTFVLNSQTAFQRGTSRTDNDATDALVYARMPRRPGTIAAYAIPGADMLNFSLREDTVLQEFRASSLPDSPFAWTTGINYYRLDSRAGRDGHALSAPFNLQGGVQDNHLLVNSYAAFGEVTLPVTKRLKATLGLRGTHEEKAARYQYSGNGLPGLPVRYSQNASLDDDFLTGRAVLSYDWTPDTMTYASISRGYVTAGFPTYSFNSSFAKPETAFPASTSWTYETGFKSRLLDDRLTLNGSAFFNDVKNGHLLLFSTARVAFSTVALDYQTYGGELELAAKVTPDFDFLGGVGYTHGELKNVPAGSASGIKSGNRVPNVPEFTANIGAEYRWSAESFGLPGRFAGRAGYQFVSDRAADIANTFNLRAYGIVNAKLTWQDGDVAVYAFATNLLDERYEAWGQLFGNVPTVRAGQGRVVGVGTSFAF